MFELHRLQLENKALRKELELQRQTHIRVVEEIQKVLIYVIDDLPGEELSWCGGIILNR